MDCAFLALEGTGETKADVQSGVVLVIVPGYTMCRFIEPWKKIGP